MWDSDSLWEILIKAQRPFYRLPFWILQWNHQAWMNQHVWRMMRQLVSLSLDDCYVGKVSSYSSSSELSSDPVTGVLFISIEWEEIHFIYHGSNIGKRHEHSWKFMYPEMNINNNFDIIWLKIIINKYLWTILGIVNPSHTRFLIYPLIIKFICRKNM